MDSYEIKTRSFNLMIGRLYINNIALLFLKFKFFLSVLAGLRVNSLPAEYRASKWSSRWCPQCRASCKDQRVVLTEGLLVFWL